MIRSACSGACLRHDWYLSSLPLFATMRALMAVGLHAVTAGALDAIGKLEDWNLRSMVLFGSCGRVHSVEAVRDHVFGTRSRNSNKTIVVRLW